MFEQVIGNGANLFIIIFSIVIGFAAALGGVDAYKTAREAKKSTDTSHK